MIGLHGADLEPPEPPPVKMGECLFCGRRCPDWDGDGRTPCADCSDGIALLMNLHQEPDPVTAYLKYGHLLAVYGPAVADAADFHFDESDFREEMNHDAA